MANTNRIEQLFTQYLQRRISKPELQELGTLLQQTDAEQQLSPASLTLWNQIKQQNIQYPVDWDSIYNSITDVKEQTPVLRMFSWKKIVVAASIVIAISTIAYFVISNRNSTVYPELVSGSTDVPAPTSSKAVITLADGTIISIDSLTTLTQAGVTVVKNADGKIIYDGSQLTAQNSKLSYNTLTNPRGSRVIDITLSDGSHVWLNAESSLKYPVAFTGNDRVVEITGEAYFEVQHNAAKPFIVSVNGMEVHDLGTEFNINAYTDEAVIKTTLVQGSASVIKGNNNQLLQPGQQTLLNGDAIVLVKNANVTEAIAWKTGFFSFNNADVQTVMRQLARWYDVEVSYEGAVSKDKFTGEIDRNISLKKMLDNLAKTRIHFRLDGKKLIITP